MSLMLVPDRREVKADKKPTQQIIEVFHHSQIPDSNKSGNARAISKGQLAIRLRSCNIHRRNRRYVQYSKAEDDNDGCFGLRSHLD